MTATALQNWHEIVRSGDVTALPAMLAEDAVFESPVVHTPQAGRAITARYLQGALGLLNNGSFRYLNEWPGETSAVLEFAVELDGITINGVDIIHWNDAGLITRFKVMVRPLQAVNLLHRRMGELLARNGSS